jgi:hypothetical protein
MAWCDPCVPRPQTARTMNRCDGHTGGDSASGLGGAATDATTTPLDRIRSAERRMGSRFPHALFGAECDPAFFYPALPAVSTNRTVRDTCYDLPIGAGAIELCPRQHHRVSPPARPRLPGGNGSRSVRGPARHLRCISVAAGRGGVSFPAGRDVRPAPRRGDTRVTLIAGDEGGRPACRPGGSQRLTRAARFSAMSWISAFCGSANFAVPSSISFCSIFASSTSRSISASTCGGGILSTWRV